MLDFLLYHRTIGLNVQLPNPFGICLGKLNQKSAFGKGSEGFHRSIGVFLTELPGTFYAIKGNIGGLMGLLILMRSLSQNLGALGGIQYIVGDLECNAQVLPIGTDCMKGKGIGKAEMGAG